MYDSFNGDMKNILYEPIYSLLWGNSYDVSYHDGQRTTVSFFYQYAETLNLDDTIYIYEDLNYFY